jgi:hypothetical protein
MMGTYPVFLMASLTVVNKLASGQTIYQSPLMNFNAPDPNLKDQMLSLVEESVRTSFLKLRAELNEKLEDLRIDMDHRDAGLYLEIYDLKETLKQEGFTVQSQPGDNGDVGRQSRELSVKLASLEREINEVSQKSKTSAKISQKKIYVLENENRMMASRLDDTQIALMSIASQSLLRTNYSDGFITVDVENKLQEMDDRLNHLNKTINDNCNTTVDMMRLVGAMDSEVRTKNKSIDTLRVSANLTSNQKPILENKTNSK